MKVDITIDHPVYGEDIDVIVDVSLISFGTPGYISGPPEKCYPPEPPEFRVNGIYIDAPGKPYHNEGINESLITEKQWDYIYDHVVNTEHERAMDMLDD
jgi:hypothetical protein